MKLRNKKTSDIGILNISNKYQVTTDGLPLCGNSVLGEYDTLDALMQEWQDYEEPKMTGWYYINELLNVIEYNNDDYPCRIQEDVFNAKAVGNYFETKEEAKEAVEKLKAWKRLKDKGLTFCAWKITDDGCSVDVETTLDAEIVRAKQKYITDDLNLLFGGEE